MAGLRRKLLLEAAADLFARQGFHAVGIDDIGAAAGVSGPAVYRHFQNKDAILRELCDAALTELLTRARRATTADTPSEVLRTLVELHAAFGARHRGLLAVYAREHRSLSPLATRALRRRQRSYEAIWVDALVLARGDLDDARAQGLVAAVLSLLNASAHMPASLDDATVEAMLAAAAAAALFSASGDRFGSAAG
ncbi:TetR family transcriptional regulator [Mycobacterium lentiflavum]|uniref:TetR family transcriptional regulator n=1 Tax=Mycobacterium lentiflavum TaxID=141349 RepID=A0A0E4CRH3_MYCLN|nr:TetR/AcrR family transcriptional regulator [Mycobacterium lentiflavum]CQD24390.1 TetR family transcriptional regulator [Mycobacterium lentiflavum]